MAQNANPLTGGGNVVLTEYNGGFIGVDLDDGLIFGDRELHKDTDADEFYQNAAGQPRPDDYKKQLEALAQDEVKDDNYVLHGDAIAAKSVLDGSAKVFVTATVYAINQQTSGISSEAQQIPAVPFGPLQPADINPGSLRQGRNLAGEAENESPQSYPLGQNTVQTNQARAAADKMGSGEDSGSDELPKNVPATPEFENRDATDVGAGGGKPTKPAEANPELNTPAPAPAPAPVAAVPAATVAATEVTATPVPASVPAPVSVPPVPDQAVDASVSGDASGDASAKAAKAAKATS